MKRGKRPVSPVRWLWIFQDAHQVGFVEEWVVLLCSSWMFQRSGRFPKYVGSDVSAQFPGQVRDTVRARGRGVGLVDGVAEIRFSDFPICGVRVRRGSVGVGRLWPSFVSCLLLSGLEIVNAQWFLRVVGHIFRLRVSVSSLVQSR